MGGARERHTHSTPSWKLAGRVSCNCCKHVLSIHLPRLLAVLHTLGNGRFLRDRQPGPLVSIHIVFQAVGQVQLLQVEATTHFFQWVGNTHEDLAVHVSGAAEDLPVAVRIPFPAAVRHLCPCCFSFLLAGEWACHSLPQALVQGNTSVAVLACRCLQHTTVITIPEHSQLPVVLFLGDDLLLEGCVQSLLTCARTGGCNRTAAGLAREETHAASPQKVLKRQVLRRRIAHIDACIVTYHIAYHPIMSRRIVHISTYRCMYRLFAYRHIMVNIEHIGDKNLRIMGTDRGTRISLISSKFSAYRRR